jgi:hypothetical protein
MKITLLPLPFFTPLALALIIPNAQEKINSMPNYFFRIHASFTALSFQCLEDAQAACADQRAARRWAGRRANA